MFWQHGNIVAFSAFYFQDGCPQGSIMVQCQDTESAARAINAMDQARMNEDRSDEKYLWVVYSKKDFCVDSRCKGVRECDSNTGYGPRMSAQADYNKTIPADKDCESPWMSHEDRCVEGDLCWKKFGRDWIHHTVSANKKAQYKRQDDGHKGSGYW